jgi:L-rhamnose mutarotase
MQRHGQLIKLKPGVLESYVEYHREVWPGVLATIRACNIRNYSIFHKDGFLFAYFEYVGTDFDKDMQKMADDPVTREWWNIMGPMQEPLKTRGEGEWWAEMDEVFHLE